jgi:hypothetical protein
MTQEQFAQLLEQELRLRFARFRLADLLQFVRDVWPVAREDPDVSRWANEFLDSGRADMLA